MSELLDRIKSWGTVHVENSDLVIRSPKGLPPELLEEARDHKAEIIQALQCRVELAFSPLRGGGQGAQGHDAEEAPQTQSGEAVTSCLACNQAEAAMAGANQDGRDEGALAKALGSDWPGIAAEVQALEKGLWDVGPQPGVSGPHCQQCGSQIAIPDRPEDPAYCTNCDALFAGPAVPIGREPEPDHNCRMCGRSEFRLDRWGVLRCRSCRPYLPGVDDG